MEPKRSQPLLPFLTIDIDLAGDLFIRFLPILSYSTHNYNMNWTGGGLSRSRNAKGSLSAKQKNYFAKARAKTQKGRLLRPALQSFDLGGWRPVIKLASSPRSIERVPRRSPIQKTLDDFENVQPLVKRLNGLKPRDRSSKRKRTPSQSLNGHTIQHRKEVPEPIIIGSSQSSSVSPPRTQQPTVQARRSINTENIDNTSTEAKRRRLLEMNDWVGIHRPTTKPVRMKFADPADRDLIGKRRAVTKTNQDPPSNRGRRASIRMPNVGHGGVIPAAHDPYYGLEDVSVRIGSAVDRSVRNRTATSLRGRRETQSEFSDELLDNGGPASFYKAPSPKIAEEALQPSSLHLSDYGHRNVLTPSAFMSDSSARSSSYSRDHVERRQPFQTPSPARTLEGVEKNGIVDSSDLGLANEPSPRNTGFRLVFEDSPYRHALIPRRSSAGRFSRDPGFNDANAPPVAPRLSKTSGNLRSNQFGVVQRQHTTETNDLAVTASRLDRKVSQEPNVALHGTKRYAGLSDSNPRDTNHLEREFVGSKALPTAASAHRQHSLSPTAVPSQTQPTPIVEEDPIWKTHTTLHTQDDEGPPRHYSPRQDEMLDDAHHEPNQPPLPGISREEQMPKAAEDEEAAWRKFVFGDEDVSDDATQRLDTASHESDSHNHYFNRNQPSLVAEAATSPLKQDPHLADETFDESSSFLGEASPVEDSIVGLTPEEEDNSIDYTAEIVSPSLTEQAETSTNELDSQPPLPQSWSRTANRSSVIGEASSSSQQATLTPYPIVSSDELQRSPDRLPFVPNERPNMPSSKAEPSNLPRAPHAQTQRREKIIYKKPPRYVGQGSSDAMEPTILGGRVLRSGRTLKEKSSRRARNDRGKGKRKREQLEPVDDDDIVDD